MPLANQLRAEVADGIEAVKVRQLLVVDREVDVQTTFGCRGNAFVETGIHVDDGVDAELRDRRPLADRRRDIEPAVVINAVEVDRGEHWRDSKGERPSRPQSSGVSPDDRSRPRETRARCGRDARSPTASPGPALSSTVVRRES